MKRFLKLGWYSPELLPRVVVAIFTAGVIYATLRNRVDDAIRASEENKSAIKNVLAEVRAVREELIQGRATISGIDDRTKRIENFMDAQSLRGKAAMIP